MSTTTKNIIIKIDTATHRGSRSIGSNNSGGQGDGRVEEDEDDGNNSSGRSNKAGSGRVIRANEDQGLLTCINNSDRAKQHSAQQEDDDAGEEGTEEEGSEGAMRVFARAYLTKPV